MLRFALVAGVVSVLLAGCQSPEESQYNAQSTCTQQGLRVGTKQYQRCVAATYDANRRQSDQATNAAVLAGAAGVIGGAVVGAASTRNSYYYGRPYYYRCRGWGC